MKLGFSGTRRGMITPQQFALAAHLRSIKGLIIEWHHGDCDGSDAQSHNLIRKEHILTKIHIHPPHDDVFRAHKEGDVYYPPKSYLRRDEDIVDMTDELVITPSSMNESPRGGTWFTYRYAVNRGKPITIIAPNGNIQRIVP